MIQTSKIVNLSGALELETGTLPDLGGGGWMGEHDYF